MSRSRRRRAAPILAAAAAGLLVATSAAAQDLGGGALASHHKVASSPQHFAFELRFSPFTPDIDSDPALHGKAPYATAFGTSAQPLVAAEMDWQAARIPHVGTIGPGVSIGYSTMSGQAQFAQPHVSSSGQLTTGSGESTTLQIIPMYAVAVLRADVLWREAHVPLVPYAKLGVGFAFWRASNTLGTSSYNGVSGVGHTWGTQLALGVALDLNPFDEYAARNFDEAMGVNNTYIFAEWTRSDLTGLWIQQDPLRVGGTFWTFGLAVEF